MRQPSCPSWCVAVHSPGDRRPLRHHGETHVVPATVEGHGGPGPHATELVVELSRLHDEVAVWVYLGDGWTGFSLSLDSAARLSAALEASLRSAGTLDDTGL